jgi:hypothetical protein
MFFRLPLARVVTLVSAALSGVTIALAAPAASYAGQPFRDDAHTTGAQKIPGLVFCAYYDLGGEGIAYHDTEAQNMGSGKLNPADGTYLNEFRKKEGLDISYTKQVNDLDSPCNQVTPPLGLLYVGWNEPGEWFNLSVEADAAGTYVADVLYTSQRGGTIGIGVNGTSIGAPFTLTTTYNAAETIAWRQWHHWNVARDAFEVTLPKGTSVLTVHIATGGNLNLATLEFRRKGALLHTSAILQAKTPLPVRHPDLL